MQAQGQAEQPRTLLIIVPYALKAADAETLGGKPLSAFQLAAPEANNGGRQSVQPAARNNRGDLPGNQASDNKGATCYEWWLVRNRDQMEVIAADLLTGEVRHRYSHEESEKFARIFRKPKTLRTK